MNDFKLPLNDNNINLNHGLLVSKKSKINYFKYKKYIILCHYNEIKNLYS